MCPALPVDREMPLRLPPLDLHGQSGTGPRSWAVSERRWLPVDVRGKSALPRLQAPESAGAGFHSRQGWGSQDRGRQGKTKHEASCNTALAQQTDLWMWVCYSKNREGHTAVGF